MEQFDDDESGLRTDGLSTSGDSGELGIAGRSASPSPTPTFAPTDRPSRRARRLRWKPAVSRPMMALSAFSLALMVAGTAGYVSVIPSLFPNDDDAVALSPGAIMWVDGSLQGVMAQTSSSRAVGPVAAKPSANGKASSADEALGLGSASNALGVSSLATGAAATGVDPSFSQVQKAAAGDSGSNGSAGETAPSGNGDAGNSASSGGSGGSGSSGASGSGSGSSGGSGSDSPGGAQDPVSPSGPSEAEEAQAHAVLVQHLSQVNGYVARLNNAIATFGNDAMAASLDQRQRDYDECAAIDSQTLTDFLSLRNYSLPSGSRWAEQKSNLQRAYIALDQYLTVYYDAWVRNLSYAEPSQGYDYWMQTIWDDLDANGNSVKAAQLNDVLASISL